MTNWNDPQWLDDWYQLLEGQAKTDNSPEALLKRHSADPALRQSAEEDWQCHVLLKSYFEAVQNGPADSAVENGSPQRRPARLPSFEVIHPECLPKQTHLVPIAQTTPQISNSDPTDPFVNRCLVAALPWFDTQTDSHTIQSTETDDRAASIDIQAASRTAGARKRNRHSLWIQGTAAVLLVGLVAGVIHQAYQSMSDPYASKVSTEVPNQSKGNDPSDALANNSSKAGAANTDRSAVSTPRLSPPASLAEIPLPPKLLIGQYQSQLIPGGRWNIARDARWQNLVVDPQTRQEAWELETGRADLELDSGVVIHLRGPSKIERNINGDWLVVFGTAYVQWPTSEPTQPMDLPAIHTTSVELRPAKDAQWYLCVDPNGETLVQVMRGEVRARSRAIDSKQPWSLSSEQQWQAHFWPNAVARDKQILPAAPGRAVTVDRQGNFKGLIDVDGQTLPWTSPERFAQVMDTAASRLDRGDQAFVDQWGELAQGWQQWEKSQLQFNGQLLPPPKLEDLWKMSNGQHWPKPDDRNGRLPPENGNGSFEFKFESHGTEQKFSNLQDFDSFMRQSMGPLFDEWQSLMQRPESTGNSNQPPKNPRQLEDREDSRATSGGQVRHRTPWGELDGRTLLIDDAGELSRPLSDF